MKLQLLVFCFVAGLNKVIDEVHGAKILALLTLTSRSHHIWNSELMRTLASRGHDVTVISPDVDEKPVANLTYIHLEGSYEFIREHSTYEDFTGQGIVYKIRMLNEWSSSLCEHQLSTKGAKLLLGYPNGKMFDLIITETDYTHCFWPFISKFGYPPVVGVSGPGIPRRGNFMTGSPKNPAYTPDYIRNFSDSMDFMQRVESFIAEVIGMWLWKFEYLPTLQAIVNRHFDFPMLSLEQYERNFSLILSNTVFGYDYPRPITPNLIPIGGMHLKPSRKLEQSLQKFLDDATDGAIFFSLGSNIKSALLPPHVQQAFMSAFAVLPQRVLWKFESDSLQHKPENVMLGKWLPQRDILGHKNIKLFITHNGLMSSQEAAYFGVPTLGIPFFMDQHNNMEKARRLGTGDTLPYTNVNQDNVLGSIKKILTNTSYAKNAQRLAAIFRDQIDQPLDRAVFWTEYVLRHKGAPHLRSAAVDMPLFQFLLLDILVAAVAVLVAAVLIVRAVLCRLWPRTTVSKAKTN